jgi:hypothetical protein
MSRRLYEPDLTVDPILYAQLQPSTAPMLGKIIMSE